MNFICKKFDELTTKELYEIIKSRLEIFVVEQKIVYQDLDDVDYESTHCFLEEDGKIVAYLRFFDLDDETIRISRVITIEHGKGHGRELMNKSLKVIRNNTNYKKILIHSQKYAKGFYEKHGFEVISDDFLEEEIVHITMEFKIK